jgi:DNA repair protein RecO (recombination protein O)
VELQRSAAVVLKKVAYGEADVIVTLYARDIGKLSALARSARRSQRRFGAALDLFTVSNAELRPHRGGELWTLGSAETTASYADLARDVGTLAHASYGTELVRELSAPEQPEPAVFDLLLELFRALTARGARIDVLRAFELALLGEVGLAPQLDACSACGRREEISLERGAVLDPARGGVVCASCAPASRSAGVRPLETRARSLLVAAQRARGALGTVDLPHGDEAADARDAMLALLAHHIGRPLRTLEFIDKIGRKGPAGGSP